MLKIFMETKLKDIRKESSAFHVLVVIKKLPMRTLRGKRVRVQSPRVNAGIDQRKIRSPSRIKEVTELLQEKSTSQSSGKLEIHHNLTHGILNTLGLGAIDEATTLDGSAIGLYSRWIVASGRP